MMDKVRTLKAMLRKVGTVRVPFASSSFKLWRAVFALEVAVWEQACGEKQSDDANVKTQ